QADLISRQLKIKGATYISDKNIRLDLVFDVNGNQHHFTKAALSVNNLALTARGNMRLGETLESFNGEFFTRDLEIRELLSLLPPQFIKSITDYESRGRLFAEGKFRYLNSTGARLDLRFGVENGTIIHRKSGS